MKRGTFHPAYAIGLVLGMAGCGSHGDDRPRLGEVDRLPRLETIQPSRSALNVQSELTATVDALEKADLCAQVRGVVKTMPSDIGQFVRERETLVTLDIPDLLAERENKKAVLEQAENLKKQAQHAVNVSVQEVKEVQAQLKRYEADLESRALRAGRLNQLAVSDTVAKQMADEARLDRDAAEAALKAAKAQVLTKEARQAAAEGDLLVADSRIKVARTDLEKLDTLVAFGTIRAPFDGVITKRWLDRGAMVKDTSTPLLSVMRTDVVRVILDVPERDAPLIRVTGSPSQQTKGNAVILRVPALQDAVPRGEFHGRVTLLAGALDPVSRTMRTEVHLENKAGLLRPQMTGTATILLGERPNALTIPSSALVRNGNKVEVYYLADLSGDPPRGVVRKTEVEIGLDDGRNVEIRGGLSGTERIITKGNGVVRTGDRAIAVRPRVVEAP